MLPYGQFYLTGNYLDDSPAITTHDRRGVVMGAGPPADTVLAKAMVAFPILPIPVQNAATAYLLHPLASPSATVQVLDTLGRVVLTQVVSAGSSQTVTQLTPLPAGLYVLHYADADRYLNAKVCRQ